MSYSRWASPKEIKERTQGVNLNTGIKRTGIPIFYDDDYLYIDKQQSHTMLIGSTGSGKTQTIILPMLKMSMMAGESLVVNDPNGDLYRESKTQLTKEGYEVFVLDFEDSRKGFNWNPLDLAYRLYKENNKDKSLKMIEDLGYYIFYDSKDVNNDPFWTNSAINYFTGLVLYLFERAKKEEINLNSVEHLATELNDKKTREKFLAELDNNSRIYLKLVGILKAPTETLGSIVSVFNQKIERYLSKENLSNMLSMSDFDIGEVINKKLAIFIISGISSHSQSLIPLFINQLIDGIEEYGNSEKYYNILLDEFDSMVPIRNFAKLLGYCRSMNIKITVTIQSYIHLMNMYKKEETEILKMCFGNIIYLLSEDIYTLEEISKYCGNVVENNKIKPLITVEELKTINVFEAIILMTRMMPIRTKLLPDYKIEWGYEEVPAEIPERKENNTQIYTLEK